MATYAEALSVALKCLQKLDREPVPAEVKAWRVLQLQEKRNAIDQTQ